MDLSNAMKKGRLESGPGLRGKDLNQAYPLLANSRGRC